MTAWTIQKTNWLEGSNSADNQRLQCPVCRTHYGHIRHVATEIDPSGDENGDFPCAGTKERIAHKTVYRRPAVRIDIEGECVHNWALLIQLHKGALILHARWLSPDHSAGIAPPHSGALQAVTDALRLKEARETNWPRPDCKPG